MNTDYSKEMLNLRLEFYKIYPNAFYFENQVGSTVNVHEATKEELEFILKQSSGVLDVGNYDYYVSKTGKPIITGQLNWYETDEDEEEAIEERIERHWDALDWDLLN